MQSAGRALSGYAGAGYRGAGYTRPPVQERVAVGMTPMTGIGASTAAMPSVPASTCASGDNDTASTGSSARKQCTASACACYDAPTNSSTELSATSTFAGGLVI